jgi:DNA-nicking Smr family endonuclease
LTEFSYRPFEKLKELLKELQTQETSPPIPKESHTDEELLFLEAMADVREIKEFRELPYRPPRVTPRRRRETDEETLQVLRDIVEGKRRIDLSKTQEYIEWVNPEYSDSLPERLHHGLVSVQDFIDLHGYTLKEARPLVEEFLREAVRKGYRCVKIIHGRGLRSTKGPVLKNAVTTWLQKDFRKWVIAYATARASDGGLGATYILLKY